MGLPLTLCWTPPSAGRGTALPRARLCLGAERRALLRPRRRKQRLPPGLVRLAPSQAPVVGDLDAPSGACARCTCFLRTRPLCPATCPSASGPQPCWPVRGPSRHVCLSSLAPNKFKRSPDCSILAAPSRFPVQLPLALLPTAPLLPALASAIASASPSQLGEAAPWATPPPHRQGTLRSAQSWWGLFPRGISESDVHAAVCVLRAGGRTTDHPPSRALAPCAPAWAPAQTPSSVPWGEGPPCISLCFLPTSRLLIPPALTEMSSQASPGPGPVVATRSWLCARSRLCDGALWHLAGGEPWPLSQAGVWQSRAGARPRRRPWSRPAEWVPPGWGHRGTSGVHCGARLKKTGSQELKQVWEWVACVGTGRPGGSSRPASQRPPAPSSRLCNSGSHFPPVSGPTGQCPVHLPGARARVRAGMSLAEQVGGAGTFPPCPVPLGWPKVGTGWRGRCGLSYGEDRSEASSWCSQRRRLPGTPPRS